MTESQKINNFLNGLLQEAESLKGMSIVSTMSQHIDNRSKPIKREAAEKEIEDQKKYFQCVEELHDIFTPSETRKYSEEELKSLQTLKESLENTNSYKDKAEIIEELITDVEKKIFEEQRAEIKPLKENGAKAVIPNEQDESVSKEWLNKKEEEQAKKEQEAEIRLRLEEQAEMAREREAEEKRLEEQLKKMERDNIAAAQTSANKASSPTLGDKNATNETPSTASRDDATVKDKNNATNKTPGTSPSMYSRFLNNLKPAIQLVRMFSSLRLH